MLVGCNKQVVKAAGSRNESWPVSLDRPCIFQIVAAATAHQVQFVVFFGNNRLTLLHHYLVTMPVDGGSMHWA